MGILRRVIFALMFLVSIPLIYAQTKPKTLNLTFTEIDVPGAVNTVVEGINSSGQMVGYYYNDGGYATTAFELNSGTFTFFNYPNAYSVAIGINEAGLISGYAYPGGGSTALGFLYDGTTFTTVTSSYPDTYAEGINNAGDVVGSDGFPNNHCFVRIGTTFHDITPPPGMFTSAGANAINNLGQVVGYTWGGPLYIAGFFYSKGKFQTIVVPWEYDTTVPSGINDSGLVIGSYTACNPGCSYHGFAFLKGKYVSFDYPGAMDTFADGVNAAGQVVGTYFLPGENAASHGFVTSPITEADFQ